VIAAAALAALLTAAQPAPDLSVHGAPIGQPGGRLADRGPFAPRELLGAGGGLVLGDAAFLGVAWGAYALVTSHTIAPTLPNFRRVGLALATAAIVLPPLGATAGAKLAGGPSARGFWKALLLSALGNAAAVAAGYYTAPTFWAILPVQLATMSLGASFGLHWPGGREADARAPPPRGEPVDPAPGIALAWARPMCLDPATP
jgi:hypothetical protein